MISPSAPESAEQDATNGKGTDSATGWNPEGEEGEGGCKCKPNTVLVHELEHAFQKDTGQSNKKPDKSGLPPDEQDAVRAENDYRNKTGEMERTDYDGKPVPNPSGPALPVPPNPTPIL